MRRSMLVAAGALACALGGPPAAEAAPYTVLQCSDSAGRPVPVAGWTGAARHDTCATGGSSGVALPANAPVGESRSIALSPRNGATIARAVAFRTYGAPLSSETAQPQLETTWENRGWPHTGRSEYGGYLGDERHAVGPVSVDAPSSLRIRVACASFGGGGGSCTGGAYWSFRRLELTFEDPAPPSLLQAPATLVAANPSGWTTSATGSVTVRASDLGGGVFRVVLRDADSDAVLHRAPVAPASATCRDADTSASGIQFAGDPVPCPSAATTHIVPVDLTALGDGAHELELGVEDAAGNTTWHATAYAVRINAPGGALPDPGGDGENCTVDDAGACVPRAPASTGPPVVGGAVRQGAPLTTDVGAWQDVEGVAWTFGWEACNDDGCEAVGPAAATFTPTGDVVGRRLRSVVTATTNGGSATVRSALTAPVDALLPVAVERPALAGVVQEGRELTSSAGTWTSTAAPVTVTFAWERCGPAGDGCAAIPGAADATYALGAADVGRTVRSVVTYVNHGGGASVATSDPSPIVFPGRPDHGLGGSGSVRVLEPIELPAILDGRPSGGRRRSPARLPVPAPVAGTAVDNGPADPDVRLSVAAAGPTAVTGRLLTADGLAVAGAQVDVVTQWAAAGARPTLAGSARTDGAGAFRFELGPGPSRIVTVGYRLRLDDRDYARTAAVEVAVTPQVRLTARRAGRAIVLAGTVPEAPAGSRKLVALQSRSGGAWRTFATTRMRGGPAFRFRHRLAPSSRTTRHQLRALVAHDPTWPFRTAASPAVRVTVPPATSPRSPR